MAKKKTSKKAATWVGGTTTGGGLFGAIASAVTGKQPKRSKAPAFLPSTGLFETLAKNLDGPRRSKSKPRPSILGDLARALAPQAPPKPRATPKPKPAAKPKPKPAAKPKAKAPTKPAAQKKAENKNAARRAKALQQKLAPGTARSFTIRSDALRAAYLRKYEKARSPAKKKALEAEYKFMIKMLARKDKKGKDAIAPWQYMRINDFFDDLDLEGWTYDELYGSGEQSQT